MPPATTSRWTGSALIRGESTLACSTAPVSCLAIPTTTADARNNGMERARLQVVPREEVFAQTGIQFMQINTLFQLYSMVQSRDPQLDAARNSAGHAEPVQLLLSGQRGAEYTHATTTQCFDARERTWAKGLLERLSIPLADLPTRGSTRHDTGRPAALMGRGGSQACGRGP